MKIYENLDLQDLDVEVWRTIKEYPDYSISNLGRVKSLKFGKERVLKQGKNSRKYFCVVLSKNKNKKTKLVHILVFEIYNNYKLKSNECIHHKDGNKENNYYKNLERMTKLDHLSLHNKGENNPMFGKYLSTKTKMMISKNHFDNKGENNPHHKLTEEQVIQIKLLLKEGILTQEEIADIFGVGKMTISKIKRGKLWKHVKI